MVVLNWQKFWLMTVVWWTYGPHTLRSSSLRDEVSDFFGNEKNGVTGPIIPLCRRGHAQATAAYIDRRTGEKKRGVFIFGGYTGLNYESAEPGSAFLQDLWVVDLWISNKTITDTNGDMGYKHSFKRVSMQVSSSSGWPDQRWQMGSTATEEGWFMLYGGEDSYRGVFFDDAWVFLERRWLPVSLFSETDLRHAPAVVGPMTSSSNSESSSSGRGRSSPGPINGGSGITNPVGGGSGNGGSAGSGGGVSGNKAPGRRKGASLVLLPASGLVVLFGGTRAKTNSRTSSNAQTSGSHVDHVLAAVNGSSTGSGGRGRDSGGSSIASSSSMVYLCDIYVVNATAAVRKAAQLHNITLVATSSGKGGSDTSAAAGLEELQGGGWKKGRELPGPCVSGASAVGIVDPRDGREKLFLFGGKHTTTDKALSSLSADPRRQASADNAASAISGQNDDNGPDGSSSDGDVEQLVLSSVIWMYDVVADSWAKEVAPTTSPATDTSGAEAAATASLLWPQARDKHAAVYSATLKTVFMSGGRLATTIAGSGSSSSNSDSPMRSFRGGSSNSSKGSSGGSGLNEEDAATLDLWGFSLVTRKWSLYGHRKRDGSVGIGGSQGQGNVVGTPLAGTGTATTATYSSASPSPSPVVAGGKNNATTTVATIPPQGSTSGSSVGNDDYVDDDDYNMDDYLRNSKWWVGPHSSVSGGSQVDKRPASRFSFGLSLWTQPSTPSGTGNVAGTSSSSSNLHRELLVMFGGERGDTPWQQQPQQALSPRTAMLSSVDRSTGTTVRLEEGQGEEEEGLVEQQVTVQTLGQSNDLWVFRLPLAAPATTTSAGGTATTTSTGTGATTSAGATSKGLDQAEQDLLLLESPVGSSSSTSSDGGLDRRYHASHSSSPSHTPTHRPTQAPAQAVGWLILSAGGCHSGDDGSVYESAVNTSAVLVAVMIGFATVGGLTAYQILKYRDTDHQLHTRSPPFGNGSTSSIAMIPSPSPHQSANNVAGDSSFGSGSSSRPPGSSDDDDITGRHPAVLDSVRLSPYQLLRDYQQPDTGPTSARQPSRSTSSSAIQLQPTRPVSAPPPTHYGLTSSTGPTEAVPSGPSSGLGLGLLASLRGYSPLTDTGDGL